MMRISGGTLKGKKVSLKKEAFKKGKEMDLRPTSAKVRQAIFNILKEKVIDSLFLDLYAGTGAVGIEALSRGAKEVVFVDSNASRVNTIEELLEKLGLNIRAKVVRDVATNFLKKCESVFDIIFVDPPYASNELEIVLPIINKRDILRDKGIVIAEHSSKKTPPFFEKKKAEGEGNLKLIRTYKYGDTSLSLYKKD